MDCRNKYKRLIYKPFLPIFINARFKPHLYGHLYKKYFQNEYIYVFSMSQSIVRLNILKG